ncbi:hypothetical protein HBI56_064530 [Parastagonospora nodorum]|uniref:WSC domain-containing protein n=1 Tax=Phaeosphaeria nodorum (strain SN15 / ATCC MYA-4574 / FGSC 10173) TaxID=321614 RepID=A0A7U2F2V8_PHANO|nr:hypothetical protein HBH56_199030 [Parastagonospora nodorum]QRC97736.1 hypothetical protein JI435_306010 [Parastagonospora nodorum SN15]KAH3924748.1 hypothetical protein HBH54_191990 [Parastagonospora nodorum]KAH3938627.1 hypothetical protein HBH53_248160 [Parastagonospora nodorum]KAH3957812.1 hypothetical protein HBH51_219790 [Parastagonospora nodorum]
MSSVSTSPPVTITDAAEIASYNRGPITEILSFPASCTQTITTGAKNYFFGHLGSIYDNNCIALGTLDAGYLIETDRWAKYYYSPAICPHGWTAAETYTSCISVGRDPTCISLGPATTAALCCPSGYSSYSEGRRCVSPMTKGQVATIRARPSNGEAWDRQPAMTNTIVSDTSVHGDGIPIYWQSSDAEVLSRAAAMTPTSDPGSVASPSNASAYSSSAPTSSGIAQTGSSPSAGLSTGAKAGIGAGVPIAVIALLMMGFFFWKRRRDRRGDSEGMKVQTGEMGTEKQVHMAPNHGQHQRYEMQGEAITHELPVGQGDSRTLVHELPVTQQK